jgi:uncharacterized membrane protein YjjB (DUF3815 family)
MRPIVLLYVLEMALAVLAPVVAGVCIVLAFDGRWQSRCRRLLVVGAIGGCSTGGLWLMTMAERSGIIWAFGIAVFAMGFSGAVFIVLAWQVIRKMRSSTAV